MNEGEKVIQFIELLHHPKGTDFYGEPFRLAECQKKLIRKIFQRGEDGKRIIRQALLWMARGSGKTTLIAAIITYILFQQNNGYIVCIANEKDQATLTYKYVRSMIEQNDYLLKQVKIYGGETGKDKRIICFGSKSELVVYSTNAVGKLGGNISCFVADEMGFFKDNSLWDAVETGMGKRVNTDTLIFGISTCGDDDTSYGRVLFDKTKRLINNPELDPSFYGEIHQGDPKKWDDIDEWKKANPLLNELLNQKFAQQLINSAKENPGEITKLLRFYLNTWQTDENAAPLVSLDAWRASGGAGIASNDLLGRDCIASIDIASTADMSALTLLFRLTDGNYAVLCWAFTPKDTLSHNEKINKAPYSQWARDKYLIEVDGDFMDTSPILEKLIELKTKYKIRECAIDRYFNSKDLTAAIQKIGIPITWMDAGPKTLSPALREFTLLVMKKKLQHFNHPILEWNVMNAKTKTIDDAGNLAISKKLCRKKVDILFALLYGISRDMQKRGGGESKVFKF